MYGVKFILFWPSLVSRLPRAWGKKVQMHTLRWPQHISAAKPWISTKVHNLTNSCLKYSVSLKCSHEYISNSNSHKYARWSSLTRCTISYFLVFTQSCVKKVSLISFPRPMHILFIIEKSDSFSVCQSFYLLHLETSEYQTPYAERDKYCKR